MLAPRGRSKVKEQEFQGNFCTKKGRQHIAALFSVVVHYLRPALSVAVAVVTGWLIKRRSSMRSVSDHRRITGEPAWAAVLSSAGLHGLSAAVCRPYWTPEELEKNLHGVYLSWLKPLIFPRRFTKYGVMRYDLAHWREQVTLEHDRCLSRESCQKIKYFAHLLLDVHSGDIFFSI